MNENRSPQPKRKSQTLGSILKRRRESLDISISEAEQATRIRAHYLEALEAGEYDQLKDDVYTKGYVKNYADYLGLEAKPILKLYADERSGVREMKRQSRRPNDSVALGVKPIKSARMVVTPKTAVFAIVAGIVALVVSYIIWQVAVLSAPPNLTISDSEARSVSTNYGFVSGKVDGGADLFINDSPVLVSADGSFRERIALINGRNEVKLTAKNRLGRVTTQTYIITARLEEPTPSPTTTPTTSTAPTAAVPFDGVQVVATVRDTPTWLIVEADGKEIYRGTLVAGASQSFSAADKLTVSTGNAGTTQLVLTNRVVQNKTIPSLGAAGEVKRGIEYMRDSQ